MSCRRAIGSRRAAPSAPPPTIRNFHIYRSLPAPINWRKPITQDDLATSQRFVSSVPLLGLVDKFDESMVLFEEELRSRFPVIDLPYRAQNVSQPLGSSREARVAKLRAEAGEATFSALMECNRYDIELHSFARKLFHERLANTVDMDAKLRAFRERCRREGHLEKFKVPARGRDAPPFASA